MIIDKLLALQVKKKKKKSSPNIKKSWIGRKIIICLLFLPILIFLVVILIYHLVYFDRIYPFVKVASVDLSGKTALEAKEKLENMLTDKPQELILQSPQQIFVWDLTDLNLVYQPESTSQKAFSIARNNSFWENTLQKKDAFWQKINLNYEYFLDQTLLDNQIASLSAVIDIPAIPPEIKIVKDENNKDQIIIEKGIPGKKLDIFKTKQLVLQNLGQLEKKDITLPVDQIFPPVTEEEIVRVKDEAQKLLGKKINLSFDDQNWEITQKELIGWLSFYGTWDEEKISTYTASLAQSIDRPPQNALFRFENNRVLEFKPGNPGQKLDQEKTQQSIKNSLTDLLTDKQSIKIKLEVIVTQPEIGTAEVNNLGINQLIGKGQSWFYGSIPSRIHNIKLAAGKLNGLLVAPGEIFSLNAAIGDISSATGFQQAYVIQSGRTVLGDGGGVCQVSTTMFRAALNAGLPIEERNPHAYRVSYYEYNSGPGLDASIYYPTSDFKFKNDTPAHILIQTTTDTQNMKLTVDLYGTSDGRQVTISQPKIWDQTPPPADLYQDDPTLAAGTIKQVDWKAWGAKVSVDWLVVRNGETLQQKTFYSSYRPWQAIFLKGTKS